ncbi:hypothetical protein QTT22_002061 [Salmonella enterica]|nr:hypothetical protein [Salmonella enterica]
MDRMVAGWLVMVVLAFWAGWKVVKPVFTNVCLSDDFVRMYNDATASTERALSGKPEN